jgi:inner membrane protein
VLLPVAAAAAVVVLDLVAGARSWPIPVLGLLDEPAHLLTAWLVLTAFPGLLPVRARWWALLGAVAIDVDHVPLYLWGALAASPGARPVTHCLLTALVLFGVAAVLPRPRWRAAGVGLSVGVLLHFVRDVATGPGLPLSWPLSSTSVSLPYAVLLVVLAGLAATAAVRRSHASARATRAP